MANIIGENCNFYTIDIGQKVDGGYQIVECNDAQMSGLSDNSMEELYYNLAKELK